MFVLCDVGIFYAQVVRYLGNNGSSIPNIASSILHNGRSILTSASSIVNKARYMCRDATFTTNIVSSIPNITSSILHCLRYGVNIRRYILDRGRSIRQVVRYWFYNGRFGQKKNPAKLAELFFIITVVVS